MKAPLSSHQSPQKKRARHIEGQKAVKARRKRRLLHETPRSTMADPAVAYWLDTFHRYHTDGVLYIPCALKLVDAPCGDGDDGASSSRHACEVALCRDEQGERWMFIVWDIDVPGMRFSECASQQEAMALYERSDAVTVPTCGVRLRPDARPW